MSKNIYSILSSFKTYEENEEDYILKREDFVSEESSTSEDDLTEISPESLIRILEKKEMFIEKKCPNYREAFQAPEEPTQPKELFEIPEEESEALEEPEKAFETPLKKPEPVVIKKEKPKVNHQIQIQNLLRDSETANPLKKVTNAKKSMYSNVIKYESVRTRFF